MDHLLGNYRRVRESLWTFWGIRGIPLVPDLEPSQFHFGADPTTIELTSPCDLDEYENKRYSINNRIQQQIPFIPFKLHSYIRMRQSPLSGRYSIYLGLG